MKILPQSLRDFRHFLDGGVSIETKQDKRVLIRTLIQADGDTVSTMFPGVTSEILDEHCVAVARRTNELQAVVRRGGWVVAGITATPAVIAAYWADEQGMLLLGSLPSWVAPSLIAGVSWTGFALFVRGSAQMYIRYKLRQLKDHS